MSTSPGAPALSTVYTLTDRDFYRDAWAFTDPNPYGFSYTHALAIVLTNGASDTITESYYPAIDV